MRGRKVLLESASAQVFPGHKVALIGSNGCGKSTLFSLLRNEMSVDAGDCVVPADWRIVSVAQETPATDRRAIEYVIDGDRNLRRLQAQLHQAEQDEDGVLIGKIHGQLEQAGAYDVEARAATILSGLGFTNVQLTAPVTDFSGGWRMRLNLAQALLCPSDLLLLDEPTNHLDIESREALVRALTTYSGAVVLVSHDMHLLSLVADRLWLISNGHVVPFEQDLAAYRSFLLGTPATKNKSEKSKPKKPNREYLIAAKAEVSRNEERLEKLNSMNTKLQDKLADPKLYEDHNADDLVVWQKKFHEVETALLRAEKLWLTAIETVERLESSTPNKNSNV